jgi:hypothetical protein
MRPKGKPRKSTVRKSHLRKSASSCSNRASTSWFDGLNRPAYQVPDQSCDCHRGTTTEEHSTGSYHLVTAADVRTNRTRYCQGEE